MNHILYSILPGLILVTIAFLYVDKMRGCECADPKIIKNLYYFEILFIAMFIINALLLVFKLNFLFKSESNLKKLLSNNNGIFYSAAAIYSGILSYFVYLVYEHYLSIKYCKCANDNMKYALYTQASLYTISISSMILIGSGIIYYKLKK